MLRILLSGILFLSLALTLTGCSNPQKDAAKASARVDTEKAKILKDYRRCLDKHSSNESKCRSYQKALDAMK